VNFLLHHHLATRDLGAGPAGIGAMLPDLWRMADRRVRARRDLPPRAHDAEPALDAVLAGVSHHLEADRWFHADPVFAEGEREASRRIQAAGIVAPRSVMLGHVLWELCLDGALLQREGLDRVLAGVRESVAAAGATALARAAEIHHFEIVTRVESERDAFTQRSGRIITELSRGPWIDGYQAGEGLAARLQGVRRSVGLAPMDDDDVQRMTVVADALLARAPEVVERIVAARF
jgi:hypothetical protein